MNIQTTKRPVANLAVNTTPNAAAQAEDKSAAEGAAAPQESFTPQIQGEDSRFKISWQANMQNICAFLWWAKCLWVRATQRHQAGVEITPNRSMIIGTVEIQIFKRVNPS